LTHFKFENFVSWADNFFLMIVVGAIQMPCQYRKSMTEVADVKMMWSKIPHLCRKSNGSPMATHGCSLWGRPTKGRGSPWPTMVGGYGRLTVFPTLTLHLGQLLSGFSYIDVTFFLVVIDVTFLGHINFCQKINGQVNGGFKF
jgi:hypothetical protein